MPDRTLTPQEREDMSAVSMLKDPFTVDPDKWTPLHMKLIKRAASYPEVDRIFVHPAIKKVLCEEAGRDRAWLAKVRPWWNHYYHFHVRLTCPPGAEGCEAQKSVSGDDGCGKELEDWYAMLKKAAIALNAPRLRPNHSLERRSFEWPICPENAEQCLRQAASSPLPTPTACLRQCSVLSPAKNPALRRPRSIRLRDKPWPEAVLLGRCLCPTAIRSGDGSD